jgi:hypothetical protein
MLHKKMLGEEIHIRTLAATGITPSFEAFKIFKYTLDIGVKINYALPRILVEK